MSEPSDELLVLLDLLHERGEVLPLLLELLSKRGAGAWVLLSNGVPIKVCGSRERADAALEAMRASAQQHKMKFSFDESRTQLTIHQQQQYSASEQVYRILEIAL